MKAQYIEAISPEEAKFPTVFLAGGITGVSDWQKELAVMLSNEPITIYNPRRENFPIDDPKAAEEQIKWEFDRLSGADIFSMWFSGTGSVQPICLYELGRQVGLRANNNLDSVVIGVEPGYERTQDVYVQMGLIDSSIPLKIATSLRDHAANIIMAYRKLVSENLWD